MRRIIHRKIEMPFPHRFGDRFLEAIGDFLAHLVTASASRRSDRRPPARRVIAFAFEERAKGLDDPCDRTTPPGVKGCGGGAVFASKKDGNTIGGPYGDTEP